MDEKPEVGKLTGLPNITTVLKYQGLEGAHVSVYKKRDPGKSHQFGSSGGVSVGSGYIGTIPGDRFLGSSTIEHIDYDKEELHLKPKTGNSHGILKLSDVVEVQRQYKTRIKIVVKEDLDTNEFRLVNEWLDTDTMSGIVN